MIELVPGTIVAQRFRVERKLADSALGTLFVAEQKSLKAGVLVEVLPRELGPHLPAWYRAARDRAQEFELDDLVDYGVDEAAGLVWFARRPLRRETLEMRVAREGALSISEVTSIGQAIGSALAAAHRRGYAHGALTPAAILLGERDAAKVTLLDFGLAHDARHERSRLTAWIAPEEWGDDAPITPAGDVWSLGLVLFYAMTGTTYWDASDPEQLRQEIRDGPIPPAPQRARDHGFAGVLPSDFVAWVSRCIARPSTRFADASQERWPLPPATAEPLRIAPPMAQPARRRTTLDLRARLQKMDPPPRPAGLAGTPEAPPDGLRFDENVQFTVYRPRAIQPARWYPLLAFAHLSERREDAPPDEPDPIAEVQRQAQAILGAQAADHRRVTEDSRAEVPTGGELTFVPQIEGVEFNPPRRTFRWLEPVHREDFKMRASPEMDGRTARGFVSVFLGPIVLAEVSVAIRVDRTHAADKSPPDEADRARPYRRIFASYSHADATVVEQLQRYAVALGDRYVRDSIDLRSGEEWSARLEELIRQADVFQLFWSSHSMRSMFVRREWEYALSLRRDRFIRPTYWEEPMPASAEEGLPPEALARLHFQSIGFGRLHVDKPDLPAQRHVSRTSKQEENFLFSLKDLMRLERSRERAEEERARAEPLREETMRRAQMEMEERVQLEERARMEHMEREEHARIVMLQEAAIQKARMEAEAQARLEQLGRLQEHERQLYAIAAPKSTSRFRVAFILLLVLVVVVAALLWFRSFP